MPSAYLYLRTKLALIYEHAALNALVGAFPYPLTLDFVTRGYYKPNKHKILQLATFGRKFKTWENGLMCKFDAHVPIVEFVSTLGPTLSLFDSWAIVDTHCSFVEFPHGGPISLFMQKNNPKSFSQILTYCPRHQNKLDAISEQIKSTMTKETMTVFYYRDGRVLFSTSEEHVNTIKSRTARAIGDLDHWKIVGHSGEDTSDDKSAMGWDRLRLGDQSISDSGNSG